MYKLLCYFNNLACIIIILSSILDLIYIKTHYALSLIPPGDPTPYHLKNARQKDMYICAMLFIFIIITLPLYTYHLYDSHAIATIPFIINILLILTLVLIVKTFQIYSKNPTFFKFTIMHISVNIITIILLATYLYPNIKFIK